MIHILEQNPENLAHLDLFSKLMSQRIIFIDEPIDPSTSSVIQAELYYLASISTEPITMYIKSPGGYIYDGLAIYDAMEFVKKTCTIKTIGTGIVASMASVLLAAGSPGYRALTENATYMIHQPKAGTGGTITDMEIDVIEGKRLKNKLHKILSKHSGLSFEIIETYCERDYFMDAEKAVELGFIDKIV